MNDRPPFSLQYSNRYRLTANLILWTALFVMGIRTVMIVVYPLLLSSASGYALISDDIHHFHIGLVFILSGFVAYKKLKVIFPIFLALSLALILEEYLVIIYEMGIAVPYNYLSFTDNMVVYLSSGAGILLAILLKLSERPTHE